MGRTYWAAGLTLVMALVAVDGIASEANEPMTLPVLIRDELGIPADTLQGAMDESSRIFEAAGIRIVWVNKMPHGRRYLVLKLVEKMNRKGRNANVLGLAASSNGNGATIAFLFYERIEEQRRRFDLKASSMLGHVMAHEMGHLLLPYGSHSAAGLMRADWNQYQAALASAGSLRFSTREASAIRARLGDFSKTATASR